MDLKGNVIPATILKPNKYGNPGDEVYIPESFFEAWAAKGLVEKLDRRKTRGKNDTKRKPSKARSSKDDNISDKSDERAESESIS